MKVSEKEFYISKWDKFIWDFTLFPLWRFIFWKFSKTETGIKYTWRLK